MCKTLKLYCEKCKLDTYSSHGLNYDTMNTEDFDPDTDINCDITVDYKIKINCNYCNHEIYSKEGSKDFQG